MHRLVPLAALLALAACAESEPPDATPAEDGGAYNMIDPVTTKIVEDEAPAIGEWASSMQEERPALAFGPIGAEPLFSIRCDDRGGILLNRHGVVAAGTTQMMTFLLGAASHRLAVNAVDGPLPMLRAAVPANDPLLEALAAHEGTIQVAVGDGPSLVLPTSPMVGAFVERCASGDVPPVAAENVGNEAENAAAPADETS